MSHGVRMFFLEKGGENIEEMGGSCLSFFGQKLQRRLKTTKIKINKFKYQFENQAGELDNYFFTTQI